MAVQSHRRDLEKENFWRWIFQEQKASQLNIRQFCKEHDLPESAFYHWRREIRKRDTTESDSVESDTRESGSMGSESPQSGSQNHPITDGSTNSAKPNRKGRSDSNPSRSDSAPTARSAQPQANQANREAAQQPELIPVTLRNPSDLQTATNETSETERIEIQTPSGFTIRLDTSIDRQTIRAILTEIDQLGRHQTAEVS